MSGVASGRLGHSTLPPLNPMLALARRYRPRQFADRLVQDHVTAVLRGAVARGRVGHGYLLTGPRGVGKTTAARILAMALNCPNRRDSGDAYTFSELEQMFRNAGFSRSEVQPVPQSIQQVMVSYR